MSDETAKPSEVDAVPDAAEKTKQVAKEPGTAPRLSEADAQPDAKERAKQTD